jgi:hypothetical protein
VPWSPAPCGTTMRQLGSAALSAFDLQ